MKRSCIVMILIALGNSGCAISNNTEAGALGGGVIGACLGTVVGAACRNPLAGAAIGGASGALIGGAAGNAEDRREARDVQAAQQWAARNQMNITDVVSMAHQHVSDSIIIQQMNTTYSNFDLRPVDITYLQQQGVSEAVIMAMQQRRSPPPGPYRVRPSGAVVIYDAPPPPPPVSFGVGISSGPYCGPGWRRW